MLKMMTIIIQIKSHPTGFNFGQNQNKRFQAACVAAPISAKQIPTPPTLLEVPPSLSSQLPVPPLQKLPETDPNLGTVEQGSLLAPSYTCFSKEDVVDSKKSHSPSIHHPFNIHIFTIIHIHPIYIKKMGNTRGAGLPTTGDWSQSQWIKSLDSYRVLAPQFEVKIGLQTPIKKLYIYTP